MSNLDQAQVKTENTEANNVGTAAKAGAPIVDLSNANDVKGVFNQSQPTDNAVSDSGQMIFGGDIYGSGNNNSDHHSHLVNNVDKDETGKGTGAASTDNQGGQSSGGEGHRGHESPGGHSKHREPHEHHHCEGEGGDKSSAAAAGTTGDGTTAPTTGSTGDSNQTALQAIEKDIATLNQEFTTLEAALNQLEGNTATGGTGAAATGGDSTQPVATPVGQAGSSDSSATNSGPSSADGSTAVSAPSGDATSSSNSNSSSGGSDAPPTTTASSGSDSNSNSGNSGGSDSGTTTTASGSGDTTTPPATGDYIPGVVSANNQKLASENEAMVTGQGTGKDALILQSYNSGLSTVNQDGQGFSQKYGYFEADAKIESGGSGWPGWWLESLQHAINPNGEPSAEMDIMEAQTGNPSGDGDNQYYTTLHSSSTVDGTTPGTTDQTDPNGLVSGLPDLSAGYYTFGLNYQPNDPNVEFYLDGKEVATAPKFSDTDDSTMMLNFDNVTGGWANAPSDTTSGPMDVKWARVFQDASLVNSTNDPDGTLGTNIQDTSATDAPPAIAGVNWQNTFNSDFTTGGTSVDATGEAGTDLWANGSPQFPSESWSSKGVSSGLA